MPDQSVPDDWVALIDLDGTTADYDRAMLERLRRLMCPMEAMPFGIPYGNVPEWLENRMDLIKCQPGFWRTLPRIEIGIEICKLLEEAFNFRLMVLTKGPRRTTSAWTEKVEWSQEHLPSADITITYDKGLMYGKVLFDDYPPYVIRWLEHRPRGKVLMLETEYNTDFSHPSVLKIPRSSILTVPQNNKIREFILGPQIDG